MNYQKPRLVTMGSAVEVIQRDVKGDEFDIDPLHQPTDPAYQADE